MIEHSIRDLLPRPGFASPQMITVVISGTERQARVKLAEQKISGAILIHASHTDCIFAVNAYYERQIREWLAADTEDGKRSDCLWFSISPRIEP